MEYWGLSDTGKVRAQNQDAFRIEELDRHTVLAAVCDGMGGAKSGNIASRLAIDVFNTQGSVSMKKRKDVFVLPFLIYFCPSFLFF